MMTKGDGWSYADYEPRNVQAGEPGSPERPWRPGDKLPDLKPNMEREQADPTCLLCRQPVLSGTCYCGSGADRRSIVVEARSHDYRAHLDGDRNTWEAGRTIAEAVGKFVMVNGQAVGVRVIDATAGKKPETSS